MACRPELRGQVEFRMADHSACLQEGRTAMRRRGQIRAEEALTAALEGGPVLHALRLRQAAKTGAWITVQMSTVNGAELGGQERRDALFLRYGLDPPDLTTYCDGCQAKFSISHSLDCKKGGLVTAHHNDLRDGVADLDGKAFTTSHVRDDPLIYSDRAVKRKKAVPVGANRNSGQTAVQPPEVTEQKGDLLIPDLWQQGTNSIHDMRVVNTDAPTHQKKDSEKCLHKAERGKKKMYLEACLQQRRRFSAFVASVEGLLGVETTATLKRIASRLATKWKQSYSKTCVYVKSRIAITLKRHPLLHTRIPGASAPDQRAAAPVVGRRGGQPL